MWSNWLLWPVGQVEAAVLGMALRVIFLVAPVMAVVVMKPASSVADWMATKVSIEVRRTVGAVGQAGAVFPGAWLEV